MKYKESLSKLYPALMVGVGILICFLLIFVDQDLEAKPSEPINLARNNHCVYSDFHLFLVYLCGCCAI